MLPDGCPIESLHGVLGVLGTIPDPAFPDVKTAKQQGFKVAMDLWRGVSAPKGTPKAVITKLQDAIKKTVESKEFKEAGKQIGFTPAFQPSAEFTKMIRRGRREQPPRS
ncbi:MAG: hypothetical protein HC868_15495 [Sphingomonadales bacterium]|nr:hypothetical protein [Sphingomonadales bacterium]